MGTAAIASTSASSSTSASAATTAPPASILSSAVDSTPDATTEARLHVALADHLAPRVDVFVNGAVAVNGGQKQVNIAPEYVTAYLYVAPGTYSVALAPTGHGLAEALVPPLDVPVVAGHRYLVAFMGEVADGSLKPLVIDETIEANRIGAVPTDPVAITLNNVVGSSGLDFEWDGKFVGTDIPYGGYQAAAVPAGDSHITVTAKGHTDLALIDEDNNAWPGDYVFGMTGHDFESKDDVGAVESASTADLNLIESLHLFDAQNLLPGSHFPSFTYVLEAIKTAGLTDLYTNGGPLLFLVPTEQAFAALPSA